MVQGMSAPDPRATRRANVKLGLILATVALTFFVGFIVRIVLLGG